MVDDEEDFDVFLVEFDIKIEVKLEESVGESKAVKKRRLKVEREVAEVVVGGDVVDVVFVIDGNNYDDDDDGDVFEDGKEFLVL